MSNRTWNKIIIGNPVVPGFLLKHTSRSMKKIPLWLLILGMPGLTVAQSADSLISSREVERVERTLSADDMQGRAVGTAGIEKAALFISNEFSQAGLQSLEPGGNFRQEFTLVRTRQISTEASLDGHPLESNNVLVFSSAKELAVQTSSGYKKILIRKGENLMAAASLLLREELDALVLVDTSFSKYFSKLARLKEPQFKSGRNIVFVLSASNPAQYEIKVKQEVKETRLANIVGVLPGKSRKNEYVIFSAHYDHLGVEKPEAGTDSIYNGANDDASGTTAVILLAKYFSRLQNNERSIIFAAFTAEEIGEYGSAYFSRQLEPSRVVAMFNIEMIGTESRWGSGSAYITGFEKSDMGAILEKNLAGGPFRFYPDPYPEQGLFYRSDNATLARLGVPAHTISTSKMDSEKYYHTPADEISTLDLGNMTDIVKAIAKSSATIVSGKDTPGRVITGYLK